MTNYMMKSNSAWLRAALSGKHEVKALRAFIIQFPKPDEHLKHATGEVITFQKFTGGVSLMNNNKFKTNMFVGC